MGYISAQKTRYSHLISGFLLLAILLFSAGSANAGVINICNDCHGMPPKDSVRKGNPTFRADVSATVGSHQKHLSATPLPNECVVCHGTVVSTFDHQNEGIDMAAAPLISGGSYGKGVFFNQTSIPVLNTTATCSSVSCHADVYSAGTVPTPIWGTAANCSACHTTPIGTNGPATGSHTNTTGHAVACISCHAAGTTEAAAPTVGHNDGNIDVANVGYLTLNKTKGTAGTTCSAASCHASPVAATLITTPAWGSTGNGCAACHSGANAIIANGPATGSHGISSGGHNVACTSCHNAGTTQTVAPTTGHADGDIDVANVGYATLNKPKGSAGTTCSAASCHASPVAATLIVTPAWGSTGNGCAACHAGANGITATGPATGSHGISGGGHNVACTSCHNTGTTQTVAPTTGHADGDIDVANVGYATLNKPKGSAGTTCSAASCHASPVAATLIVTPAWGSTGNGCAACHTGVNAITASGPVTGSHTTVAGHAVSCTTCHATGTTATVAPTTGHADGDIDVANVGYATLNKPKGTAGTTCSAASCHASPVAATLMVTPAWGTTGNGCAACHTGVNAITATGPATGSHALAGHAAACISCHAAGTTATVAPSTGHADGNIDVANVGYLTLDKTKGTAGTTCSAASCHASPVAATLIITPAWGTTGNGCAACHTGANAITATGPATGSHTTFTSHAVACTTCHATGTTATTVPASGHADGNIDVANVGYALLNKPKGSAGTTCSTTVCHGSLSPAWGANTTNATCTKCHGVAGTSTAAYSADPKTAAPGYNGTGVDTSGAVGTITGGVSGDAQVGAHDIHLKGAGGYKTGGIACADCHAVTALGDAGHMNGAVTMTWSNLARNVGTTPYNTDKGAIVPGYTAPTCSTNYCHGGGFAAAVVGSTPSPSWVDGTYLANSAATKNVTDCNRCHISPPTGSLKYAHTSQTIATDCSTCHGHNGGTSALHINGILEATGGDCNSCHDYDSVGSVWTGAPTNRYTTTGTWGKGAIAAGNTGWGAHAKHINYIKARLSISTPLDPLNQTYGVANPGYVCGTCHTVNSANHNNGSRSINFNDGGNMLAPGHANQQSLLYLTGTNPGYDTVARTCSNLSCHYFTSPAWSN